MIGDDGTKLARQRFDGNVEMGPFVSGQVRASCRLGKREYRVKGSTIETKFDFVQEHFGKAARRALEEQCRDLDILPVLPSAWYSYKTFTRILGLIAENHYAGDLSRLKEVGRYSARQSFATTYRPFLRRGTEGFIEFLQHISSLHKMFYSYGWLEVHRVPNGRGFQVWLRDKPVLHPADLHVATGFYLEAARLHEIEASDCWFASDGFDTTITLIW